MNVVAMIGMEIHAAPLSALFLEVVKIVIINVLLVSIIINIMELTRLLIHLFYLVYFR